MLIHLILLLGGLFFQQQKLEEVSVSFEITHLGALTVEGGFTDVDVRISKLSASEWKILGTVTVSSVDTGNENRDRTILGEQYLDAETYPVIPFDAKVKMVGEKKEIEIDLELRGISFQLTGELVNVNGKLKSRPITFKRSAINLDFGLMDSLIGDDVTIVISTMAKSWPH